MSSQVLLYSGLGSNPFFTDILEEQFQHIADDRKYRITRINNFPTYDTVSDPNSVKALLVPGGNSAHMYLGTNMLSESQKVCDFIQTNKLSYYGACAGGILSTENNYLRDNHDMVGDYGFISLTFPCARIVQNVHSMAPLFPIESEEDCVSNFTLRNIDINEIGNGQILLPHISGPGYRIQNNSVEILSKYKILPSIVIQDRFKNKTIHIPQDEICESFIYSTPNDGAKILATGTHPELSSSRVRSNQFKETFQVSSKKQEYWAKAMENSNSERVELLQKYYKLLDISCKESL